MLYDMSSYIFFKFHYKVLFFSNSTKNFFLVILSTSLIFNILHYISKASNLILSSSPIVQVLNLHNLHPIHVFSNILFYRLIDLLCRKNIIIYVFSITDLQQSPVYHIIWALLFTKFSTVLFSLIISSIFPHYFYFIIL